MSQQWQAGDEYLMESAAIQWQTMVVYVNETGVSAATDAWPAYQRPVTVYESVEEEVWQ